MPSAKPTVPEGGQKITISGGKLQVPDHPIIPFIEATERVGHLAVLGARARRGGREGYGGKRSIKWMRFRGPEVLRPPPDVLPERRSTRSREFLVGIKGPSRRRSAAASARSTSRSAKSSTSTCACAPVRWFNGVPSPVKHPRR